MSPSMARFLYDYTIYPGKRKPFTKIRDIVMPSEASRMAQELQCYDSQAHIQSSGAVKITDLSSFGYTGRGND